MGASYLWPACGACETHVSECQPGLGIRNTTFGQRWVGNGFRGRGGDRWLRQWKEGEAPRWLKGPIQWDAPGYEWRTQRPPEDWQSEEYEEELWRRRWVDWYGRWKGPDPPRREWWVVPGDLNSLGIAGLGAGSRGRRRELTAEQERGLRQLLLIADPNGRYRMRDGGYSPISRLAEQLVTDAPGFHTQLYRGLSNRLARERRQAIAMYLRRFFVDHRVTQARGRIYRMIPCGSRARRRHT